ncbi:MAG TPA: nuclear transport factor 2 family protein [Nitrososphaerales archaeon]|nr:nuclear transport factor 2 family protein [Nitrososphaerales archaeon]
MAKRRPAPADKNKAAVRRYFRLVMAGKPKDAIVLFAKGARHHNPYLPAGIDALLASIAEVQAGDSTTPTDAVFKVGRLIADGDNVAAYTTLVSASDPSSGMRQVHIFRFRGGRIAEYWDVTQTAPEGAPNTPNMW